MAEDQKRYLLLSSDYDSSYQLSSNANHADITSDTTFSPTMTSTLVAKADSGRPCSPTYGSRGETSTIVVNSFAANESSTPEADKLPLLSEKIRKKKQATERKLSMIFGVTIPCCLSIFCVILFLRIGFVLGQAGYWQTMLMLVIGYLVVILTVLSISAIATSATVEGGGVYFMISRALGPEFGGSVGVVFFVANIFASASFIIGFVEALTSNLGQGGSLLVEHCGVNCGLPSSYSYNFLYGTAVLLFCLVVCLIGAGMFAKATFIIFIFVVISLCAVMFSFFYVEERTIPIPKINNAYPLKNISVNVLNYTSWSWLTFKSNLGTNYSADYTQPGTTMMFQSVFAIMFNGCTGIMAGANISGDLKNPSVAIPQGTLLACAITFVIYIILFTFSSFTCSRELLLHNYNYLQYIDVYAPLITLGVFAATLSAGLSNLIGASRVLQALAKDRLFSGVLHPFTWTLGKSQNPIPAVILSWLLVQVTLLFGKLNTIAPIVTMFFLVSYGVVNLAAFALKVASAPNFRPTFQVQARYTSFVGALGCFALMFFIEATYASLTVAVMILLFVYLLIRGPATPWGDVSQALIYHQVRKYLLHLDIKKRHVKFWRPEVLLMVANPRSSLNLIDFTNDLKKGGLYVMGHVIPRPFNTQTAKYYSNQLNVWLAFVEISKVKSFVELTVAPSIRSGTQNLLATAGLGGMKPNTLALGFYDRTVPISSLSNLRLRLLKKPKVIRSLIRDTSFEKFDFVNDELPPLRTSMEEQTLTVEDYVGIIQDAVILGKNICIMRHFDNLNKKQLKHQPYIDVWPLQVKFEQGFDDTFMLLLQLACVLHMKADWKSHTKIRIFIIPETIAGTEREILQELLKETRIEAIVNIVPPFDQDVRSTFTESFIKEGVMARGNGMQTLKSMNVMMQQNSSNASVIFTALPPLPVNICDAASYIENLNALSSNLPPTVMVYGNMPVMATSIA